MNGSSVQDCSVSRTLAEARAPSGDVRVVAVVGSRPPKKDAPEEAWDRWRELKRACIAFVMELPAGTIVVSGGARGIDQLAESTARAFGHEVRSYRPWQASRGWWQVAVHRSNGEGELATVRLPGPFTTFAQAAHWRNGEMVRVADRVAAFHDGVSRGTADTIRKAKAAGKLIP